MISRARYHCDDDGNLTISGLEAVYSRSTHRDDLAADVARVGFGTLLDVCRFHLQVEAELDDTAPIAKLEEERFGETRKYGRGCAAADAARAVGQPVES